MRVPPLPTRRAVPSAGVPLAILALFLTLPACDTAPTELDRSDSLTPAEASSASAPANGRFPTWHQGFGHGHAGWYGAEAGGELGWCGGIRTVDRRRSGLAPSAGRGYALVSQGPCNAFWEAAYPGLVGAPWAPGPEFSAMFAPMSPAGYVQELDIWLDPTWEAVPPEPGTWVFELDPEGTGAVFGYSVSFAVDASPAPALFYVRVPVMPGAGELLVGQGAHAVTEAGWYTFRHHFRDRDGRLAIDFELIDGHGDVVGAEPVEALYFSGLAPGDFETGEVLTGYAWFTSISTGLELPIDEHRVRPGR